MAVNMNGVNSYSAYQSSYNQNSVKGKKGAEDTQKSKAADQTKTSSSKQLSPAAQKLLEKLRSSRSNMDFMVADFENGDQAKEILSRGTKEFSVLFSSEELEKMASDEKYYEEKMASLDGAVRMSEEINAKFGFTSGGDKGELTKVGISFNSDGTTSFFAELEKVSEKQRDRIERAHEKRAEEKKEAQNKENASVKRVSIEADSKEELFKMIGEIDWSKIKEEPQTEGRKFDYSV